MLQSWAPAREAGGGAAILAGHAVISTGPVKWAHASLVVAAVPVQSWGL